MESRGSRADREELLERLVESSVLVQRGEGEIGLSSTFERERETQERRLRDRSDEERADLIGRAFPELSVHVDDVDLETIRDGLAIRELTSAFTPAESLRLAFTIGRVEDPPRAVGAPEGFTPLRAREIPLFTRQHPVSIVYVWQDDCDPCDDVREILSRLVNEGVVDERTGLGSVSGEGQVEYLHREYDVGFVPTTLFFVGDRVDSRLLGAKRRAVYEAEVGVIQEGLPDSGSG